MADILHRSDDLLNRADDVLNRCDDLLSGSFGRFSDDVRPMNIKVAMISADSHFDHVRGGGSTDFSAAARAKTVRCRSTWRALRIRTL